MFKLPTIKASQPNNINVPINYRAIALQCSTRTFTSHAQDHTVKDILELANIYCLWLEKNKELMSELEHTE